MPWEYTVTDHTGTVIATGTTRRRPTTAQARWVKANYPHCVFPGCRMPAQDCDLDHQHHWATTRNTCTHTLYPHCRHHHRIRHTHNWTYTQLPDNQIQYTTRLGHKHTTQPRDPPLT